MCAGLIPYYPGQPSIGSNKHFLAAAGAMTFSPVGHPSCFNQMHFACSNCNQRFELERDGRNAPEMKHHGPYLAAVLVLLKNTLKHSFTACVAHLRGSPAPKQNVHLETSHLCIKVGTLLLITCLQAVWGKHKLYC